MIHALAPYPIPQRWPRYALSRTQFVLQRLAEDTWDRLSLSHQLGLSVGEQTITDINVLELVRLRLPRLHVYKAHGKDEPTKGFDWEWWVGSSRTGYWRYSIQAKKLDIGAGRYLGIRHHVGHLLQINILEDFARVVSAILCKRFSGRVCILRSVPENRLLAHPAGAARRESILPERRAARKGARFWRGVSGPLCASTVLAPTAMSTGGAGGVSGSSCW